MEVNDTKWLCPVFSKKDFIVSISYNSTVNHTGKVKILGFHQGSLVQCLVALETATVPPHSSFLSCRCPTDSQVTPFSRSRQQDLTAASVPTQSILQNARQYYKRSLTMRGPPSQCRVPINNEGGLKQQSLQDSQ